MKLTVLGHVPASSPTDEGFPRCTGAPVRLHRGTSVERANPQKGPGSADWMGDIRNQYQPNMGQGCPDIFVECDARIDGSGRHLFEEQLSRIYPFNPLAIAGP